MLSEPNGSAGVKRRWSVAPARATLEVSSELRSDPYPQRRTLGQGSKPGEGLLAASMYPTVFFARAAVQSTASWTA